MSLRLRVRRFRSKHRAPRAISEAEVGADARIQGFVESIEEEARSMFTGRPCVAANLELATPIREEDGVLFKPIATHEVRRRFAIVDDHGERILVAPASLQLEEPMRDVSARIPHTLDPESPLAQFLRDLGIAPADFMGVSGAYGFLEARFAQGDAVEAFGRVGTLTVSAPGAYRSATTTLKAFVGDEKAPTILRRRRVD